MKKIFLTFMIFCLISPGYSVISLGTKFSTVVLEKLQPGEVYNITKLRNLPLIVINNGDTEQDVVVEVEIPSKEELKEGYEPIIDPTWVKFIPNKFKIKPKEEVRCEVIISIPDDKNLVGRHFQLKIWTHTVGDESFGAGVVNRMFISIGSSGPDSVKQAKRKKALYALDLDVSPDRLYLNIPLGRRVNVSKELKKTVTVVNKSNFDVVLKLESVENILKFPLSEGFEFTPDTTLMSFDKEEIKVKKRSMKDINIFFTIPKQQKYFNKKLVFILRVTPIKPELAMEFYTRIFVTLVEE